MTDSLGIIVLSGLIAIQFVIGQYLLHLKLIVTTSCSGSQVLSPNNGGGQIYLILLEIVLTHSLHLEQLLASLSFSKTFLLCSTTAFSQDFYNAQLIVCFYIRVIYF